MLVIVATSKIHLNKSNEKTPLIYIFKRKTKIIYVHIY